MALALTFGLLSALLWGTTDFMIRIASQRIGIVRAMLYAQATSALVVAVWIATDHAAFATVHQESARGGWLAALLAAATGLIATASLYQALHKGRVSVVAPIAAGYGAVTVLLSSVSGERLAPLALLGLLMLVAGAIVISRTQRTSSDTRTAVPAHATGAGWALVSCVGYGLEFWIQGRFANPQLGPVMPVVVYYLLSTSALATVAGLRRISIRVSVRDTVFVCGTGLGAIAGFLSLSMGFGTGHVAVVTAAGSAQSAVTVALACLISKDRPTLPHCLGLAAIIGGLCLLRLG